MQTYVCSLFLAKNATKKEDLARMTKLGFWLALHCPALTEFERYPQAERERESMTS